MAAHGLGPCRFVIWAMVFVLLAAPASAQSSLQDAMQEQLADALQEMRDDPACIEYKRSYRLAYLGIPIAEPHLFPSERHALNATLIAAIADIDDPPVSVTIAETLGELAGLSSTLQLDEADFQGRLDQLNADITLIVQVGRPASDVARLNLSIIGRLEDGGAGCDRQITLFVDPGGRTTMAEVGRERDILTFQGLLASFLDRSAADLAALERIALVLTEEPESCVRAGRFMMEFRRGVFEFGNNLHRAQVTNRRWPTVVTDRAAAEASLTLTLAPAPSDDRTLFASFALHADDSLTQYVSAEILASEFDRPHSCSDGNSADQGQDPGLRIMTDRPFYRLGDDIRLTIVADRACTLALVNVEDSGAACLLLPFPGLQDEQVPARSDYHFPPIGTLEASELGRDRFIGICALGDADAFEGLPNDVLPACGTGSQPVDRLLDDLIARASRLGGEAGYLRGEIAFPIRP